ncbi:MAG: hypothetical protein QXN14_01795 [Ignisphaera sp.]
MTLKVFEEDLGIGKLMSRALNVDYIVVWKVDALLLMLYTSLL